MKEKRVADYRRINDILWSGFAYTIEPERYSIKAYSSYEAMVRDCNRMIREYSAMEKNDSEKRRWKKIILILITNIKRQRGIIRAKERKSETNQKKTK